MARPLRVLITAGPTREYIDPVRYLSNESSGQMGLALVQAALDREMPTTLVHGPIALRPPPGCVVRPVVSAADMLRETTLTWPQHDLLIMAAAVADYRPVQKSSTKIKKTGQELELRLVPTADVLSHLGASKHPQQTVVGFALEDQDGRARAEQKLMTKRLDGIALNDPSALNAAESRVELYAPSLGWRKLEHGSKTNTARQILDWAVGLWEKRQSSVR